MPKYALEIALRYIRLQFEKGVGRSIPKITTELVTNSDDSYKRMTQPLTSGTFGQITIIANRRRRKMLVIDQAKEYPRMKCRRNSCHTERNLAIDQLAGGLEASSAKVSGMFFSLKKAGRSNQSRIIRVRSPSSTMVLKENRSKKNL